MSLVPKGQPLPGLPLGRESWVTSGEEGRTAPLQSSQHLGSPLQPQTKEQVLAVGLVM